MRGDIQMDSLTTNHILGAVIILVLFIGIGIFSGKSVKNDSDFGGGRNAGTLLIIGTILGTLIGGNSTIGTAQMAFTNGLSGLWFTIGSSAGCLVLGLIFAKPLRDSKCATVQEIIRKEYGQTAGVVTSVLSSLGILLIVIAQMLAANALLSTMFGFNIIITSIITIVIMTSYVAFGGIKSVGLLGIFKLVLIYIAVVTGGFLALNLGGGLGSFYKALPTQQYFNIFSRGIGIDIGAVLSVLLGILTSQIYVQALISGKTIREARRGLFISSALIPPIGLLSTFIGMYMRITFPNMDPAQAFPKFVIDNLPPLFSGIILATLLITIMGSGSGVALGFSTIFTNDIYKRFINKNADSKTSLKVTRVVIVISLIVSAIFTSGNLKSAILTWGFMSMGLRAVSLLLPMSAALFFKGRIDKKFPIASSIIGTIAMVAGSFMNLPFDTLFLGMSVSFAIMGIGAIAGKRHSLS